MEQVSTENLLLAGSTLLVAGVLAGKSSHRVGLPLLLIFLLTGMAFGTDGLGMQFSYIRPSLSVWWRCVSFCSREAWVRRFRR